MSRRRTVRDFPVEYLGIWQLAVAGKLRLEFPSPGTAANQRQQLHTYRKRLGEESPSIAEPFFQVDLKIETTEDGKGILTGHIPAWKQQVREQLAATDFRPADPVASLESAQTTAQAESGPALDKKLKDLGFTT